MFIIRVNGPAEAIPCGGIGPMATGIAELPLMQPIKVRPLTFRSPSADGSNQMSGSKADVVKLSQKTAETIVREIRQEFKTIDFKEFTDRESALAYLSTGMSDHELLGVECGVNESELRQAWIRAQQSAHPDKGGDVESSQAINGAYARLKARTPAQT